MPLGGRGSVLFVTTTLWLWLEFWLMGNVWVGGDSCWTISKIRSMSASDGSAPSMPLKSSYISSAAPVRTGRGFGGAFARKMGRGTSPTATSRSVSCSARSTMASVVPVGSTRTQSLGMPPLHSSAAWRTSAQSNGSAILHLLHEGDGSVPPGDDSVQMAGGDALGEHDVQNCCHNISTGQRSSLSGPTTPSCDAMRLAPVLVEPGRLDGLAAVGAGRPLRRRMSD